MAGKSVAHSLTNAELVALLQEKRLGPDPKLNHEYIRRLERLKIGYRCEAGHGACALVAEGPCSETMDPQEGAL